MSYIYVLATLDTKGPDAQFVCDTLAHWGIPTRLVDTSCLGEHEYQPDITRDEVFAAAGTTRAELVAQGDRGVAVTAAALGVSNLLSAAHGHGAVGGVLALGGSAGTTIGTAAMRALPLGVPKLMVSTLASGQTRAYVGDKDIFMLNSVVDIAGVNRISRRVLSKAAAAMAGMVKFHREEEIDDKPLIAASMFGVTTPCVLHAKKILEDAGFEVLTFHATGNGGEAMESLVREGLIAGVLDITTTELADELVGGILSAGPTRLTAAAEMGVPQVVSVGALDMVNFGPRDTVPEKFRHRKFHVHNANVTLMRTTVEENKLLGAEIGRKVAIAPDTSVIVLPLQGVSALDRTGQPFDDPAAREALLSAIRVQAPQVACFEYDGHINDSAFAELAARTLLQLIEQRRIAPL